MKTMRPKIKMHTSNSTNGICSIGKNTPSTLQKKSPDIDSSINITNEYSNLQRQTPKIVIVKII